MPQASSIPNRVTDGDTHWIPAGACARAGGYGNDGPFLAGPNASPILEPSAPAQIVFDCKIAARRRPEPTLRHAYSTAFLKSQ